MAGDVVAPCGCGGGTYAFDERASIMLEGFELVRLNDSEPIVIERVTLDYTGRCPGCGQPLEQGE